VPAWRVFLWFKLIELGMQARPKALWRVLFHRDPEVRHAMRWYTRIGRRVWFHEVAEFFLGPRLLRRGPTLKAFLGASLAEREYVLDVRKRARAEPVEVR
jgi:anaerobic magnesium-protoporphyrin IX monomethyl ester cyclase